MGCDVRRAAVSYTHLQTGMALRFKLDTVSCTGRATAGVRGIDVAKNDAVRWFEIPKAGTMLFVVSDRGFGKRMLCDDIERQGLSLIHIFRMWRSRSSRRRCVPARCAKRRVRRRKWRERKTSSMPRRWSESCRAAPAEKRKKMCIRDRYSQRTQSPF